VPRKPRVDLPDSVHHVSALACGEEPLFRESEDRREFLRQLCKVSRRYEWRCDAYCLMGTHFHLIVYTVEPTLSAGMGRLCGTYAQWFNWKYDRRGHLFARRFMSRHIVDEAHLLEVHRYVALNPLRAGLCRAPAQWPWGSYKAICGLERPAECLDVTAVHGLFGLRTAAAQRAYGEFVRSGIERLGSDPFRGQTPDVREASMSARNVAATRPTASS
jgi:putative transposase